MICYGTSVILLQFCSHLHKPLLLFPIIYTCYYFLKTGFLKAYIPEPTMSIKLDPFNTLHNFNSILSPIHKNIL